MIKDVKMFDIGAWLLEMLVNVYKLTNEEIIQLLQTLTVSCAMQKGIDSMIEEAKNDKTL